MKPEKSLVYFLSHPIQYFSPLLKELAKSTALQVYYFSDSSLRGQQDAGFGQKIRWDTPLTDGYDFHILKNYSGQASPDNHFFDVFNPGVIAALWKNKAPVVIVNGWTYSSTLLVILFGRLFGKKIWLRAENPLNQELGKRRAVLILKKIFLKHILFRLFISKCLYIGTENRRFFEYYGVGPSKLLFTPYSVDNEFFRGQAAILKGHQAATKVQLGLPAGKKIILFSGKYIAKKRPMDLLKAFKLLNDPNCALVMVGEGQLRKEMEQYILENNLQDVYLTGFINQSLIPRYYSVADVFVMCSGEGETWGLSVNEAMNFEKPVIVSKTCGSCSDLVRHGENGFAFGTGDIAGLAGYLKRTMDDEGFRTAAGRLSGEIIRDYSIGHIVRNLVASLN